MREAVMSTTTITQQQERQGVPEPGTYALDVSHSAVEFVARHLMISKVRGRLADFDGVIHVAEAPEESSVEVTINPASVDSADTRRDEHLRSPDFLDVERYPTITFRSTKVERAGDDGWKVTGDL